WSRPATRAQASIREVVLRFIVSSSLQDVAPSEGTQVGKQRGAPRLVQAAKALPGDGGLATVPQDGLDEVARPAVVQQAAPFAHRHAHQRGGPPFRARSIALAELVGEAF